VSAEFGADRDPPEAKPDLSKKGEPATTHRVPLVHIE
jgi:hypothetical protein